MLHICNIYKLDAVACVEHYYSMSTEVYGVLLPEVVGRGSGSYPVEEHC